MVAAALPALKSRFVFDSVVIAAYYASVIRPADNLTVAYRWMKNPSGPTLTGLRDLVARLCLPEALVLPVAAFGIGRGLRSFLGDRLAGRRVHLEGTG